MVFRPICITFALTPLISVTWRQTGPHCFVSKDGVFFCVSFLPRKVSFRKSFCIFASSNLDKMNTISKAKPFYMLQQYPNIRRAVINAVNPQICDPVTIRKDSELLQHVEILTGD